MSERKKTNRTKAKYPGLNPGLHPKSRQHLIDHDYIDKLSPEEKQWLSDFNEEYVGASFCKKGRKFHRTKKQKKDCYDRNNARNRDISTVLEARRMPILDDVFRAKLEYASGTRNDHEDVLLELMEIRDKVKESESI